ncbi:hypothetical protein UVI_02050780 [Ustilaginoidea virens]|uniref:F-box domain-containing protein n=1 Tax=Ustilaginoidea virens TaxID=1159556 RepID=A0A1B5L2F5_USTVR|nr:hypothetical protein UVI_02050780 [Ustilaginoidea virens]
MASANLDHLPTEIYLKIFRKVADIGSLDSLLRASPTAYRLFDAYAVEITEAVLESGFTFGHIRVIFRIIALLRAGTLPISSLRDLCEQVLDESMIHKFRVRESRTGCAPRKLRKDTSPAVLRSVLATTRHINCIAHECLSTALARFNALEPEHLVDEALAASPDDTFPFWKSKPATKKFRVTEDFGPPIWTEEQRVTRACWRLQLIYDLKRAAERGKLVWPEADISTLKEMAAIVPPTEDDPFNAGGPSQSLYNLTQHKWVGQNSNPAHPEFEEIVTIIDHVRDKYGHGAAEKMANGFLSCKHLNGNREIQRVWPLPRPISHQYLEAIQASYAARLSPCSLLSRDRFGRTPQLGKEVLRFHPYRPLGFAFWTCKRLQIHGFCEYNERKACVIRNYFAWCSVLGPEELARVERDFDASTC